MWIAAMSGVSEQRQVESMEHRLVSEYNYLPPEIVTGAVRDAYARFMDSRLRDFVLVLVERRARKELTQAFPKSLVGDARLNGDLTR
ncbi:hypothetical protein AWB85_15515 [Mycobacteroides immunogenum]|uniref:Uncharacterized protein n=1 Tax=Mycobacteroides immunogenum TaxID=83262 RepID=A0A179V5U5_9MYCO|nr:hypothetical protein AWB85_15515 [Mycobacteroides immunogenum]